MYRVTDPRERVSHRSRRVIILCLVAERERETDFYAFERGCFELIVTLWKTNDGFKAKCPGTPSRGALHDFCIGISIGCSIRCACGVTKLWNIKTGCGLEMLWYNRSPALKYFGICKVLLGERWQINWYTDYLLACYYFNRISMVRNTVDYFYVRKWILQDSLQRFSIGCK